MELTGLALATPSAAVPVWKSVLRFAKNYRNAEAQISRAADQLADLENSLKRIDHLPRSMREGLALPVSEMKSLLDRLQSVNLDRETYHGRARWAIKGQRVFRNTELERLMAMGSGTFNMLLQNVPSISDDQDECLTELPSPRQELEQQHRELSMLRQETREEFARLQPQIGSITQSLNEVLLAIRELSQSLRYYSTIPLGFGHGEEELSLRTTSPVLPQTVLRVDSPFVVACNAGDSEFLGLCLAADVISPNATTPDYSTLLRVRTFSWPSFLAVMMVSFSQYAVCRSLRSY